MPSRLPGLLLSPGHLHYSGDRPRSKVVEFTLSPGLFENHHHRRRTCRIFRLESSSLTAPLQGEQKAPPPTLHQLRQTGAINTIKTEIHHWPGGDHAVFCQRPSAAVHARSPCTLAAIFHSAGLWPPRPLGPPGPGSTCHNQTSIYSRREALASVTETCCNCEAQVLGSNPGTESGAGVPFHTGGLGG